jgi:tetratricopeptide (TPR) repeat protein
MRARPIAKLACIPLLCASALAASASCDRTRPPAPQQSSEGARSAPIVLVGLDAADWLAIDPLIRAGKLPTFARLRALGRTGIMTSTPPLISPIIWTTIATGVEPENHGVLDFMADLPDGRQVPVGASQRRAPALWNLFSNAGRRVAVVGWWATWPAETVKGTIVSDALAPQLARSAARDLPSIVSPSAAEPVVRRHVVDVTGLARSDLASYVPLDDHEFDTLRAAYADLTGGAHFSNRLAHLGSIIASGRTYTAIAEDLLAPPAPDLLAVYFEAVDTVSHLFVRDPLHGAGAIERAYVDADALLHRLARASPPDTLFVVCSDHGFYPPTAAIKEDPANLSGPATAWHRPYGIVAAALAGSIVNGVASPTLSPAEDLGTIRPIDIAPTLLHAAGLEVPADLPGQVVTAMLPADRAGVPVARTAARPYQPPAMPATGAAGEAAIQRLRALGYIGATRTSLARQNLGESFFRRGKLREAERELRAVVDSQPQNVAARLWLAQALARQGRGPEALAIYEQAIVLPGGAADALVEAVDLAVAAGDVDRARHLVSSVDDPASALHVARGTIAQAQHNQAVAEREYRAALAADPVSFDAAARLLDLLSGSGRADRARAAIERAVRLAPDSARHVALLGQLHLQMRDARNAETVLRRALELAPDGASVRAALARALLMQQKPAEAIDVVRRMPESRDRDVLLGSAYAAQKNWSQAATHLRAALDAGNGPPDVTVLNGLGWAELQLGRRDEAMRLFAQSLSTRADQPEIRKLLAQAQQSGGTAR